MAPLKFKPWLPANWNYCRRELIIALEFIVACVIAQLFLDHWLAAVVSEFQSSRMVRAFSLPDRVQLSLLFTAGMILLIAYRMASGVHSRTDQGMFVFGCGLLSGFAADKLKIAFGRSPPDAFLTDGAHGFHFFGGGVGLDSFPSSHAAMAAGIAGALSTIWPARRCAFLSLGVIVAASRLTEPHYLSDVLFGFAIGLAMVVLVRVLFYHCGIPLDNRNSGEH